MTCKIIEICSFHCNVKNVKKLKEKKINGGNIKIKVLRKK